MMFKHRLKQLIVVLIDALIVIVCEYLALSVRFDMTHIPGDYFSRMIGYLPFDILITLCIFFISGLYGRLLSLISFGDMVKLMEAVAVSSACVCLYKFLAEADMPRSFYVLYIVFLFIIEAAFRLCIRLYFYYQNNVFKTRSNVRTMLIGAGSGGYLLMRELAANNASENKIVCVIDDDQTKHGKYLRGVKIIGGRNKICAAVREYDIEEIIIAIPSLTEKEKKEMVVLCNRTGCVVRILPEIASSLHGQLVTSIRDVDVRDVIGRESINVNQQDVHSFIRGRRILVTGGGGSIGSELCRQIMANEPEQLVIFDIYENNAYDIQQELKRKYGLSRLSVIIGSVRDYDRLEKVFKDYRPEIVFHAAAHKHVPLMEDSPCESIKNNCLGTLNAVKLADRYGAGNFVLISTDKAVRPTNVMGASKRICEMIMQAYAMKSDTRFSAVRFGNVLGSNGSVVPLFMRQIKEGGPVTVTHRDITRFFMTIPEAVSLVLQASIYAGGGEIFVLDMGEPVKIYDLAEKLITLSGLRPNKDIKIEITGLRPGEKLYEEILMDEEGMSKTPNKLIHIGKPIDMNYKEFMGKLEQLIEKAYENVDAREMKTAVAEVCDTYAPDKEQRKAETVQPLPKQEINYSKLPVMKPIRENAG